MGAPVQEGLSPKMIGNSRIVKSPNVTSFVIEEAAIVLPKVLISFFVCFRRLTATANQKEEELFVAETDVNENFFLGTMNER
jgi:hypothetical protein